MAASGRRQARNQIIFVPLRAQPLSTSPAPLQARPLGWLLAGLCIGLAFFLRHEIAPYAGGSDSSGYLNSAKLLRNGSLFAHARRLPAPADAVIGTAGLEPLGFLERGRTGRMAPTYPLGLPLHLVAASWFVGLDWSAIAVNTLSACAAGLLLYACGLLAGLPPILALGGAVLLWLCPLFLLYTVQPMSDGLAVTWSLAALYTALRSRGNPAWALPAGVAVAVAVLVRPSNLLILVPVGVALGLDWRRYLWLIAGGLPGAACFAWYNASLYGSPLVTGYGSVWINFSAAYLPHNLLHFARWIPGLLSPLVLAAFAASPTDSLSRVLHRTFATWAVVLTGFYAFYFHSGETWWYLRFILPAFPALIVLALSGVRRLLAPSASAMRMSAAAAALVCAAAWEGVAARHFAILETKHSEVGYMRVAEWVDRSLPPDAVVLCMQLSGSLFYYTPRTLLRWDQFPEDKPSLWLDALVATHAPIYAALYPFENEEAERRVGGRWTRVAQVENATIWKIEPPN